ncbi:hypothetical protein, partial [Aphanothece stagnina]|uniref:hypothetical protein n=1 Tax=Aphanothece stagnina TaxID=1004305 RepID=UPI00398F848D
LAVHHMMPLGQPDEMRIAQLQPVERFGVFGEDIGEFESSDPGCVAPKVIRPLKGRRRRAFPPISVALSLATEH